MKQIIIKQGTVVVENIPAPMVEPQTILVRVEKSCISVGTEMSGVKMSGLPLWRRALQQPANVKKVVQMVASHGIVKTKSVVYGRVKAGNATGYSAAGVVQTVGPGVEGFVPGDRVACAGAQCAHHAEIIRVPINLATKVPESLSLLEASSVTLGAIALQGVRRATPTLGENFVVLGLGIIGQITAQLLRINGCKVIGVDINPERMDQAIELGLDIGLYPEDGEGVEHVNRLTDGLGADSVIITAATPSDKVLSTAFKMCRKKGRVVLVGDVGMNINRSDIYTKELDFFISTSYGPGRYDNNYEEKGLDYPAAYVRWTENRNMSEYLRLVAAGHIRIKPLIAKIYPIDDAHAAYESLKSKGQAPLMIILDYPKRVEGIILQSKVENPSIISQEHDKIRFALVGAGGFAKGVHLPNIKSMNKIAHLQAIVSRTGHNALATCKQFDANYATTDYEDVLGDPDVDAVIIATRHDKHAAMVLQALNAGKHVFVEKPLALTNEDLDKIQRFYEVGEKGKVPLLLTGYNRRFSKYALTIKKFTDRRTNPMILNYRMNAGYINIEHWVHNEEGGGRNRGEACHIYDFFTYLTDSRVVSVEVSTIKPKTDYYRSKDNFIATIRFEEGSVGNLIYTALGCNEYPKENLEIFFDGKVVKMTDFQSLEYFGVSGKKISDPVPEKGQKEELKTFIADIKTGNWTIPLWQQIQAVQIANKIEMLMSK
jgi:predicted dehydrogenase/threonine dehydrogenase-like Zn-dependent dehydrogenase